MALGYVSVAEAVQTRVAQDFALGYAYCAFVGIFVGVFKSGKQVLGVLYYIGVGVKDAGQAELVCFERSFSLYLVLLEDASEGSIFPAVSAISMLLTVAKTTLVST